METDLAAWAYQTMAGGLEESYHMPGVEDAFMPGSYCMGRYAQMLDAYERLCNRLGVQDVDDDVEVIICALMDIQEELCQRMYDYGARFGTGEQRIDTSGTNVNDVPVVLIDS